MSALSIQPTFPIFTDIDGQPLEDGYIWIGAANLAPIGNPINVYWDAALTISAAQPIRTRGGYPVNSGTPARLYVNDDYSIQVQNKNGSVVYSAPTATERYNDVVIVGEQIPSVLDYGAVGDGITDDRQAFIDAINANSIVYVPPGTYLCNGPLELKSNFKLYGAGTASIIKWGSDFSEIKIANAVNVIVEDLLIDGGGQTTNIYTGVRGCTGIYIYIASNIWINRVTAQNMGIINQADPFGVFPSYDIYYGGFGFFVSGRFGPIKNIRITNCTAYRIAATGYMKGDGFICEGYGYEAGGTDKTDVVFENCHASVCGRHCFTVSGGTGEDIPSGVIFNNCYGEKSALNGCDVESGYDVVFDNCIWRNCGNDQTYYNPAAHFGVNYRLLGGIAIDNSSKQIVVNNNTFVDCYYGFTFGGSTDVVISNSIFRNSTLADLIQLLAGGTRDFRLTNCSFETPLDFLDYYLDPQPSNFFASGCYFAGTVAIRAMRDGIFDGCVFKKGVEFRTGGSLSQRNKIVNSVFEDFAGNAISTPNSNAAFPDFLIEGNTFNGTGNLVNGIDLLFNCAVNWMVSNNKFVGLTGSGVYIANGGDTHSCDIVGNNFESCANGILIDQSVKQSIFANNSFGNISGWCIRIQNINAFVPMLTGPSIMNNMARNGCVNGISIAVTTGSFDYTMLVGNNVHACSGTKWSLPGGNANGVVANNITT